MSRHGIDCHIAVHGIGEGGCPIGILDGSSLPAIVDEHAALPALNVVVPVWTLAEGLLVNDDLVVGAHEGGHWVEVDRARHSTAGDHLGRRDLSDLVHVVMGEAHLDTLVLHATIPGL